MDLSGVPSPPPSLNTSNETTRRSYLRKTALYLLEPIGWLHSLGADTGKMEGVVGRCCALAAVCDNDQRYLDCHAVNLVSCSCPCSLRIKVIGLLSPPQQRHCDERPFKVLLTLVLLATLWVLGGQTLRFLSKQFRKRTHYMFCLTGPPLVSHFIRI